MTRIELHKELIEVMHRYRIDNHLQPGKAVRDCIEELEKLRIKTHLLQPQNSSLLTRSELLDSLDRYKRRPWWKQVFNI